ncbi:ATP-binding protein [Streptomyces sp. NPDC056224]|uniref:ATP-binding protein n=1 Tax=Streptomyces sp. NPDC056224 TaxID=3345750 RepID=UPI0035DBF2FB
MLHGQVQGRDFRLGLSLSPAPRTLRIEVTDARREMPVLARPADGETGRGLLLVASLADRWGVTPYPPGGRTVWAEAELPSQLDRRASSRVADERL